MSEMPFKAPLGTIKQNHAEINCDIIINQIYSEKSTVKFWLGVTGCKFPFIRSVLFLVQMYRRISKRHLMSEMPFKAPLGTIKQNHVEINCDIIINQIYTYSVPGLTGFNGL